MLRPFVTHQYRTLKQPTASAESTKASGKKRERERERKKTLLKNKNKKNRIQPALKKKDPQSYTVYKHTTNHWQKVNH